jgi:tetratricopeptide (TPR) repeat protein
MNDYVTQFRNKMTYYWLSAHFADLGKFSAQVVSVARKEGDAVVQAAATLGVARHLRATGKFRMARAGAESSYQQAEALGNVPLMVDALVERARIFTEGYFDPLEARNDLEQALTLAISSHYVEGETLACVGMARAELLLENPEVALSWADEALKLARDHLDNLALAEAGLARGLALMALRRAKEADHALDDALTLCKRLDYDVYRPLIALAILMNQSRYTPEHLRILRAYATGDQWRDHFAVRWLAFETLAHAHLVMETGDYLNAALRTVDHLRELAVEAEHPPLAMAYLRWMAYLLSQYGSASDRADAPKFAADWLALAQEHHNPFQQMLAHAALGTTNARLGRARRAYESYRAARQIAQSFSFFRMTWLVTVQMLLSGLVWQIQRVLGWLGLRRSDD